MPFQQNKVALQGEEVFKENCNEKIQKNVVSNVVKQVEVEIGHCQISTIALGLWIAERQTSLLVSGTHGVFNGTVMQDSLPVFARQHPQQQEAPIPGVVEVVAPVDPEATSNTAKEVHAEHSKDEDEERQQNHSRHDMRETAN
jgi:hypothetical protein